MQENALFNGEHCTGEQAWWSHVMEQATGGLKHHCPVWLIGNRAQMKGLVVSVGGVLVKLGSLLVSSWPFRGAT